MGLREALGSLNRLREKGEIKDFAIAGAHAVMAYTEPFHSKDLDILIVLKDDYDLANLYGFFKKRGNKTSNLFIVIDDINVHFLPSYMGDIYREAIEYASVIEELSCKVVSREYLIALLLIAYRPKDKIDVKQLLPMADRQILDGIIGRFIDEENLLRQRFEEVLA